MKLNRRGASKLTGLVAVAMIACVLASGCGQASTGAESAAQKKNEMGTGKPPPDQLAQIKAYNDKMYAQVQAKTAAAQEAIREGKPPPQ